MKTRDVLNENLIIPGMVALCGSSASGERQAEIASEGQAPGCRGELPQSKEII